MKLPKLLVLSHIIIAAILLSYLAKYPVFPEFRSADFIQHFSIASQIARTGQIPSFSNMILYGAAWLWIALWDVAFKGNPIQMSRFAMSALVFISPSVVWLAMKEVDAKAAGMAAIIYTLSGFVWFGVVFDSGLYANFVGMLASLLLLASVFRLERTGIRMSSLLFLVASLMLSLFSHYSVLLVYPPLMLYLGWRALKSKPKKSPLLGLGILSSPLLGLIAYPSAVSNLLSFYGTQSGSAPAPTFLSSVIPLPVFSYAVAEVSNDLLSFLLMVSVVVYAWSAWKTRDGRLMLVLAWLAMIVAIAPFSSIAWRFAFIALVPATLMLGHALSLIPTKRFIPNGRNLGLLFLLVIPTFVPSWGGYALSTSMQSTDISSQSQAAVLQAMSWMRTQNCVKNVTVIVNNETVRTPTPFIHRQEYPCIFASVTDWRFTYSVYLGGPTAIYAGDYGVIRTDTFQTQLWAATNNAQFIMVTDVVTGASGLPSSCDPRFALGLTMTANASVIMPNHPILLNISAISGIASIVSIYDGSSLVTSLGLVDGKGAVSASFPSSGTHELRAAIGTAMTSPLLLTVAKTSAVPLPRTVGVPPDYCLPWNAFSVASMKGWSLVYSNFDVHIWKIKA